MAKQSKQPVVYVARELNVDGIDELYSVMGWFVSKAYLKNTNIEYTEEGDKYYDYTVDYTINPTIPARADNKIYTVNGDNVSTPVIFSDYKSCKTYARSLNKYRFDRVTRGKSEQECEVIKKTFREVMQYAKRLEDRFIAEEEKQQIVDNPNIY